MLCLVKDEWIKTKCVIRCQDGGQELKTWTLQNLRHFWLYHCRFKIVNLHVKVLFVWRGCRCVCEWVWGGVCVCVWCQSIFASSSGVMLASALFRSSTVPYRSGHSLKARYSCLILTPVGRCWYQSNLTHTHMQEPWSLFDRSWTPLKVWQIYVSQKQRFWLTYNNDWKTSHLCHKIKLIGWAENGCNVKFEWQMTNICVM